MCELFQQETHTNILHVAYRGSAPAFTDVIGGRVDFFDCRVAIRDAAYTSGNGSRPLAMMSSQRAAILPDVPTAEEVGLSGIDLDAWFGLMVPAGTPVNTIKRLNDSINAVLLKPEVQEVFTSQGYVAPLRPNTPETLEQLIAEETGKVDQDSRERNIKPRFDRVRRWVWHLRRVPWLETRLKTKPAKRLPHTFRDRTWGSYVSSPA